MSYLDNTGLAYLWSKIKTAFAAKSHTHVAGDITSGTLAISNGGTGATTAAAARMNLDAAQSNGASGTLKSAETEIDNLEASLAYVESTTARTSHAAGDYFMIDNVLMKATATIATGEQITTSNAVPATLQSQIDTLRDSVYQPDRMKNVKTDVCLIDVNNPYAAINQPGCVRKDNDSVIVASLPSEVSTGAFYALWDCYHMVDSGGTSNGHILVEMREMVPVAGRVWQNWYNWNGWSGWVDTSATTLGVQHYAAWTADYSNNANMRLTNSIYLPAGTYLITAKMPNISTDSYTYGVYGTGFFTALLANGASTFLFTATNTTELYIYSAQTAACTFSYKERGYIQAVRIR